MVTKLGKPGDVVFYQHPVMKGFKGFLKMVHTDGIYILDHQAGDSVVVRELVPTSKMATVASPKNIRKLSSRNLTKVADKEFRKW